jgi:gamma-glutamyltranspeptidase / glutathione hydrolase
MRRRLLSSLLAALALVACAGGIQSNSSSGQGPAKGQAMVAAADPRAVDAGVAMLAAGGSATDAAIATIAVLGLVEPQSAGVGGGGFLMSYNRASGAVAAYDGRESAPAAATPDYFLGPDGKPLPFRTAVASGRSTGAPSLYAMLKLAHDNGGKLAWTKLFEPAIKLADEGFVVSPRMSASIASMADSALKNDPAARAYLFLPDGAPLPVGFVRKNPEYAATLRAIAKDGPKALQQGPIADAILTATHAGSLPGVLTRADLRNVKPRKLPALCGTFRTYKICGAPPPTSGGVAVNELLGLYERARPQPGGAQSADDWAAFIWASRLAYADRDFYIADDAFTPMPLKAMMAPAYLDQRFKQADLAKAAPAQLAPGDPAAAVGEPSLLAHWGGGPGVPEGGTTHLSIVDANGDAVAMTASVEAAFGAERMAAGFFLNNQLTDFSFAPSIGGKPVANSVAAGKKPRSSMSPTIVFDAKGDLYAIVGSPGGSSIIAYVAKTVIALIDWKLTMQQAVDQPNVVANSGAVRVERDRFSPALSDALTARGWSIRQNASEVSGVNAIVVRPEGLEGGADSRREGVARAFSPSPAQVAPRAN